MSQAYVEQTGEETTNPVTLKGCNGFCKTTDELSWFCCSEGQNRTSSFSFFLTCRYTQMFRIPDDYYAQYKAIWSYTTKNIQVYNRIKHADDRCLSMSKYYVQLNTNDTNKWKLE